MIQVTGGAIVPHNGARGPKLRNWGMTTWSGRLLRWSPRILGVLVCLFLSLFSLDAFEGGKTLIQALPDFALHVAPLLVLLAAVGVSWRWEWVSGLVFTAA